jgi:Ca2+-binding EF-hand superfamily protein
MKTSRAINLSAPLVCAMAFLAATSVVTAQESIPATPGASTNRPTTSLPPANQFAALDSDKDGKISSIEYTNANMAAFRSMDKDRDGKVSGVEMTEAQPSASGSPYPLSSAQLSEIDADKDSQLTAAEASSGALRMFANLDINGDQSLSANELNTRQYRTDTEASLDSAIPAQPSSEQSTERTQ